MISDYAKSAARDAAKTELVKGILWLIGGALITAVTYAAADPGGSYFVFWGVMAYGGFRFLRGLYYYANPQSLLKDR